MYPIDYYRERMAQEREIIPRLLRLFEEYQIRVTWAVVGFLFFDNVQELQEGIPYLEPDYKNKNLSPYSYIANGKWGEDGWRDSEHFAPTLIKMIQETHYQKVSTHTFSHFYCLEEGQTLDHFREDLTAAIRIAEKRNCRIESIVFPRNQFNKAYINVLKELGIRSYRGNPSHWIYKKGYSSNDSAFKRAMRLMDSYFNLSGHNCYSVKDLQREAPVNVPASHFLRPYSRKLHLLEPLRLHRILAGMTHAAKSGSVYHLWWHPYNLASDQEENMRFIKQIIKHYKKLQAQYGIISTNMEELTDKLLHIGT